MNKIFIYFIINPIFILFIYSICIKCYLGAQVHFLYIQSPQLPLFLPQLAHLDGVATLVGGGAPSGSHGTHVQFSSQGIRLSDGVHNLVVFGHFTRL